MKYISFFLIILFTSSQLYTTISQFVEDCSLKKATIENQDEEDETSKEEKNSKDLKTFFIFNQNLDLFIENKSLKNKNNFSYLIAKYKIVKEVKILPPEKI